MPGQLPMVSTGLWPLWTAGLRLRRFPANRRIMVSMFCSLFQVVRLLRERGCNLGRVWLGGNSLAEADQWVWPDGQQVSQNSAMWGRGEPSPGRGECMMLVESQWEAADCLDDKSVEAFLAHHKPADSTKPHTRPTTKPTQPLSTRRTTIVVPRETTHPGKPQTPS